jgi:hypothetical protein
MIKPVNIEIPIEFSGGVITLQIIQADVPENYDIANLVRDEEAKRKIMIAGLKAANLSAYPVEDQQLIKDAISKTIIGLQAESKSLDYANQIYEFDNGKESFCLYQDQLPTIRVRQGKVQHIIRIPQPYLQEYKEQLQKALRQNAVAGITTTDNYVMIVKTTDDECILKFGDIELVVDRELVQNWVNSIISFCKQQTALSKIKFYPYMESGAGKSSMSDILKHYKKN